MASISKKLLVGIIGLLVAGMPLVASAQNFDNGPASRTDPRGHYDKNGNYVPPSVERRGNPPKHVRRQAYAEGYFGAAPGGWQGYFHDGGWYHHRHKSGGVWHYYN
jgi:hypothetical protein